MTTMLTGNPRMRVVGECLRKHREARRLRELAKTP
jgi:hypothetical protein